MEEKTLLKGSNLCKAYGDNLLFEDLQIEINKGTSLGIVGRNGTGKTTLINILLGVIKPDGGEVERCFNAKRMPYEVGVQMQDGYFEALLRLGEISNLFCDVYELPRSRGDELIKEFDLTHAVKTPLRKLSGGEKQKVNIILSILHQPNLLFFDEITTGLDSHSRNSIYKYLKDLRSKGLTMVLVSHYYEEIWNLCDQVLIFGRDKKLFQKAVKDLGDNAMSFSDNISNLVGGTEV